MRLSRRRDEQESVAIIGIGCRYGGGIVDFDSFQRVIAAGVDAVGTVPPERWSSAYNADDRTTAGAGYCGFGAFLPDVGRFDASFFGIRPDVAREIDPQHRLLLEVAWEAAEDAGLGDDDASRRRTGVFFGMLAMDYLLLHAQGGGTTAIDKNFASGREFSFAAGRLSYLMNLHGPAMTVNTACSSSLVAVHLACRSLISGESDVALAGGVNVLVAPDLNIYLTKLGALSPTGRCKPFDARADGLVRGEGVGVVVLKRLADAEADGDRVLAVIRGTAVNHNGRAMTPTMPCVDAQVDLIGDALFDAGAHPDDVRYVEAHGPGTPVGDPVEADALSRVFTPNRPAGLPLYVGSVKANLGHTDAAAGVAGLLKAVHVLRSGQVPPQLHHHVPNPAIDWARSCLRVMPEGAPLDLPAHGLVGVSSIGLSGTNAHILLGRPEVAPVPPPAPRWHAPRLGSRPSPARPGSAPWHTAAEPGPRWRRPLLLLLSGADANGLAAAADGLADLLAETPVQRLPDIQHTLAHRRWHLNRRAAVLAQSLPGALHSLRALADGRTAGNVIMGNTAAALDEQVGLRLVGEPLSTLASARYLYQSEPDFRQAFDECRSAVGRTAGRGVRLLSEAVFADRSTHVAAQISVQIALCELWRLWGLAPESVTADGIGRYAKLVVTGEAGIDEVMQAVNRRFNGRRIAERARCRPVPGRSRRGGVRVEVPGSHLDVRPNATVGELMEGAAHLFCQGITLDWSRVLPGRHHALPRRRFGGEVLWSPHAAAVSEVPVGVQSH
ncbi:beta-ketoacyl synthase N-terminal-like domain-containing protein [Catellatospora sp. NPDC049609]|uniref:beta-ketoacyl synthase N-terminal-like domain-containing protein n=1 Tax=Catellatospora sp. NPDC049609 TaxID=3155505 RepID=UPI0034299D07